MSEIILEMRNVTKTFPGVVALDKVTFDLRKGEILAICGENGAGKSTLMKILSGSYPAGTYEGEIFFDGEKAELVNVAAAEALGIEMVYQELNMMPEANVAENLFVGNLPGGKIFVDFEKLYADTEELLSRLSLKISPKTTARELNSGQLQLLAIMRAYIKNPRILVLDEPTSALTVQEMEILFRLLDELQKKGVSCIYISHKLDEVFRISNRVLTLRDGQTISCHDICDVTENMLIEEMVGRKVENLYPKNEVAIGQEVLRVENLVVPHPSIKGRNIVDHVSFTLKKGEILGIGGLVGAGRSEILGGIFGQLTKGVTKEVYVEGKRVEILDPQDAIQAGIGFVTEERKKSGFVWTMSIRENLTLANLKRLAGRIFIDRTKEARLAQVYYDRMKIKAPSLETEVNTLSGGNQQKVVVGKWLVNSPKILFMDEPTKGIDVGAKAEIYRLMGELTENGVSIVMVSSDMPELVSMSDRCLVVCDGRITRELTGDDITQDAVLKSSIRNAG